MSIYVTLKRFLSVSLLESHTSFPQASEPNATYKAPVFMRARALLLIGPSLFVASAFGACSDTDKAAPSAAGGSAGKAGGHNEAGAEMSAGQGGKAAPAGGAGALGGESSGGASAGEPGTGGAPYSVCNDGKGAVITGRVTTPSGELPLSNVSVYVPSTTVDPLPFGTGCWSCAASLIGTPVALGVTGADGKFVIENAPVGGKVPLVVQTGKWRRQLELEVVDCQENAAPADSTRLPRDRNEGDLPRIALVSGAEDTLECLLRKLGIADSEFGTSFSSARVRLFQGKGGIAQLDGVPESTLDPMAALWTAPAPLNGFDLVLLGSESDQNAAAKTTEARAAIHDYVASGGRLLVQHFQNYFLSAGSADFAGAATFSPLANLADPFEVLVDQGSARGKALAASLQAADAQATLGKLAIHAGRNSVQAVNAPAVRLLYGSAPATVQAYSQDVPMEAGQAACGRLTETELLTASGDTVADFPKGCQSTGLSAQERALAYLLFDLGACIP